MERTVSAKVIDLTPHLAQTRRSRLRDRMYTVLALWTQYLSMGVLVLYGLLRLTLFDGAPLGAYSGPLALLWPVSFPSRPRPKGRGLFFCCRLPHGAFI